MLSTKYKDISAMRNLSSSICKIHNNDAMIWLGLFLGSLVWSGSPAEHTGRRHPLVPQGTSGAGHAKPECQSGGFPGPFVCRRVRTARFVQHTRASVVAADRHHPEHLLDQNKEKETKNKMSLEEFLSKTKISSRYFKKISINQKGTMTGVRKFCQT